MRGTSRLEITMGKQRKTWSTDVKEAIVLSVLRGELGVAEAARQHGVNESLIHTWKTQFLEAGRARLAGDRQDQGVTTLEREGKRPPQAHPGRKGTGVGYLANSWPKQRP